MGEMSARAAVAFFELCSFNRSRCLVGGVDWHGLRVQRVGRCMVQLGGTIALLRVEQIWVGTESASREMICWNQRREMLRWQSSENHLRRLPPRDWRDGRRCLPQRVRHHELPLPLPSSSRRPLALACARARLNRVLTATCFAWCAYTASELPRAARCRSRRRPCHFFSRRVRSRPSRLVRSPLNARGLLHNSTDLRVLTAVCFACFVWCSRVCSCRSRAPACRQVQQPSTLVTLAFLSKRVVNRELNDEECVCVRSVRKACGLRGSLCLFWAIVL